MHIEKRKISDIETVRHSLAHLLAAAVLKKYPKAKLGVGPVVENGFYYDFKLPKPIAPEDLKELEATMREWIKAALPMKGRKLTPVQARKLFKDQPFKLDLIKDFSKAKKPLTVYALGSPSTGSGQVASLAHYSLLATRYFADLCRGGHIKNTKEIDPQAFALDKIAGAYWKGDDKNPQLTRIYVLAFGSKKELNAYIEMQREAEKRDHRKLGEALDIFTFDDEVGPGLPLWLPNGAVMIEELERLAKESELAQGYVRVRTPHIAKESLYITSGHLPHYKDSMFPPMEDGGETYYLKAMNCPHHHKIYKSRPKSYKDLPLRFAEYGTCYRYEKSGELFGLMRVRSLQMNDAHIYMTKEQFADEFRRVNDLYLNYFKIFGVEKYVMRFSTHDPKGLGKKYVNDPKLWKETEKMVRDVLVSSNIPFVEVADEAAFYGPKIDVQVWSAIGKEFTLATNQVDFAQPRRFGLTYTNAKGKEEIPVVIHRAPLGTHERFIGFLIEHYAGAFPLWLAPIQARVLPVGEKFSEYAKGIVDALRFADIRAELSAADESLGKRIRESEMKKVPYTLVVGEKEESNGTVSVRRRGSASAKATADKSSSAKATKAKQEGESKLDALIMQMREEIANRKDK